jgi:hypothetical protein
MRGSGLFRDICPRCELEYCSIDADFVFDPEFGDATSRLHGRLPTHRH